MITIGIVAGVAIFYFLHWYSWAFWILVFAIVNGLLGTIRAVIDPDWYFHKTMAADVEWNFIGSNYTGLFVNKAIVLAILLPLAWYMGTLAGYIGNSN